MKLSSREGAFRNSVGMNTTVKLRMQVELRVGVSGVTSESPMKTIAGTTALEPASFAATGGHGLNISRVCGSREGADVENTCEAVLMVPRLFTRAGTRAER